MAQFKNGLIHSELQAIVAPLEVARPTKTTPVCASFTAARTSLASTCMRLASASRLKEW